ncbi:MAG TPA: C1 family peptidase [Saprospiraceae bacterium]|nr:C1 family peptidase [Saprospiraceae bacterium]
MFRYVGLLMFLAIFMSFVVPADAQDDSGVLPEDEREMKSVRQFLATERSGQYPSFFLFDKLVLSPEKFFCNGFPLDQGRCASCAGCAIAQAYSIHYAFWTKQKNRKPSWLKFSGSFVYNQIKQPGDCRQGARISSGLKLLTAKGICPADTFPHSPYTCGDLPQKQHWKVAAGYKIAGFEKVTTPDMKAKPDSVIINALKNAIVYSNPVIACIQIPKSLAELPEGKCKWQAQGKESTYWHAVVITGYDEHHFQILNSKGCRWGCNGLALVPHAQLASMLEWSFVMTYLPR